MLESQQVPPAAAGASGEIGGVPAGDAPRVADEAPVVGVPVFQPDIADPADDPSGSAVAAAARLAVGPAPDVRADDPWSEAGRKVLRFHLARMLSRVPGVLAGEDPEEVHAMRVAARRMRAAWRVFGDGFERPAVRRYRDELQDIGRRLGAVRDLDVLIGILLDYGQHRSDRQRTRLEPLLAAWNGERQGRRGALVAALCSQRFLELVDDYEAFVTTPGLATLPVRPHAPSLVRDRMPSRIWDAYQAVRAFDGELAGADLATLHQLRIAGKWLRYTLEFVREPLDPEAAALIKPVVALQDHLGEQHDAHVAALLAREHPASARPGDGQAKAVARFAADMDATVERLGRGLAATWRPIASPVYRRALGRALARL